MVRSGKDHKTPRPSLRKAWMWALGFLCFVAVLKQSCLHAFNDKNESLPQIPNVCLYQEPLSHAPEFLLYQWQLRNHPISQLHRCHPAHSRHYPYGNCLCLNKHRDQYCVINLTPSHHDIKGRNTPVVLEIKANPERWDDLSTATRSRGEDRRDQVFRFQIHCCLKKKNKTLYFVWGVAYEQCCDSLRWTPKGLSHTCPCICSPPKLRSHPGCHRTLSRVLCAIYTAGTGWLSILNIASTAPFLTHLCT